MARLKTKQKGIKAHNGINIAPKNRYALIANRSQLEIRRKLERKSFIMTSPF